MVNTNTTDLLAALAIGDKVRSEVNKQYRLLELDTDGVYASILLLAKKKYAALAVVNPMQWACKLRSMQHPTSQTLPLPPLPTKQELKGLDIVRRDWCRLAVHVGRDCVSQLLSGASRDTVIIAIHNLLSEVAENLRASKVALSDFIITKVT
ncbi:unnamed protein product [Protopolystoma xenopodis]|uniref:DNA-directed DNA polymerase n=1 Tax=Protopolystoma xenopodis TaxID=117903 RepID=A0A3S5CSN1_9PLAT|nr:unnamed protein product [Protopolystoma xenopodis]